jgi:cytochrome c oxidase subunit 3
MIDHRMGDLIPYRSQRARSDFTAYLGMGIFLASWAMLFAGLFFVYGGMRARQPIWPPLGQPALPVGTGWINTAVLLVSSAALQSGLVLVRRGKVRWARVAIAASLVLGLLFIGLQMETWSHLYAAGLTPASGPYGGAFYALTCFHALHVTIGLFALAWLLVGAFRGSHTPARHLSLRLWTMYWHFVGAVWVAMFAFVYLI